MNKTTRLVIFHKDVDQSCGVIQLLQHGPSDKFRLIKTKEEKQYGEPVNG